MDPPPPPPPKSDLLTKHDGEYISVFTVELVPFFKPPKLKKTKPKKAAFSLAIGSDASDDDDDDDDDVRTRRGG